MYKRWVAKALIECIWLSTPKKQKYIKKTKKGDPIRHGIPDKSTKDEAPLLFAYWFRGWLI